MYPLRRQVDLHRCQACTMQRLNFLKSAEHVTDGLDQSLPSQHSSCQVNESIGCLQTPCISHVKKGICLQWSPQMIALLLWLILRCTWRDPRSNPGRQVCNDFNVRWNSCPRSTNPLAYFNLYFYLCSIITSHHMTSASQIPTCRELLTNLLHCIEFLLRICRPLWSIVFLCSRRIFGVSKGLAEALELTLHYVSSLQKNWVSIFEASE